MCTRNVDTEYILRDRRSVSWSDSLFFPSNVINLSLIRNEHAGEEGPHSPAGQSLVNLFCFSIPYSVISILALARSFRFKYRYVNKLRKNFSALDYRLEQNAGSSSFTRWFLYASCAVLRNSINTELVTFAEHYSRSEFCIRIQHVVIYLKKIIFSSSLSWSALE